jgi:protein arginine kinase activator
MLCQNCNKNEANMHMKRIINGRAAEVHLCSDCARSLGYGEAFSGMGFSFVDFFGDFLLKNESLTAAVRCGVCGKTFEDIATDGKIGCAECYNAFYEKLLPSLTRVHGKTAHMGKRPLNARFGVTTDIEELKTRLEKAVMDQDFETAAKLRDEIRSLLSKGGEA